MIIDDNEDFLDMISYWFQSKGHHVLTAINCEAGLKIVETAPVDIVFLDMRMPNVDGVETLRRIRKIKKDLPVMLVTAYPQDDKVKEATELGIAGVFRKDGGFEALQSVMETTLDLA